jgi:glycerophosphoryl diester phosphodiesterase
MPGPFTLIAYRGGAAEAPENTCEAFARAARLVLPAGLALALEVDLRMTRDGALVAMHDERIERTTNGFGSVEHLTLAELRKLDASGERALRGVRVPTLEEVLEVAGSLEVVLDVHGRQRSLPAALFRCLRRQDRSVLERVIVASEHSQVVERVRRLAPELRTAATAAEVRAKVLLERLRLDALAARGRVWMVPETHGALRVLTPRFVEHARARGDEVWPWLAADSAAALRFRAFGATGVFTPCPAAVAAAWPAASSAA